MDGGRQVEAKEETELVKDLSEVAEVLLFLIFCVVAIATCFLLYTRNSACLCCMMFFNCGYTVPGS